ncbi:MAG TPA: lipase secretion chaperone [Xylella sp.]
MKTLVLNRIVFYLVLLCVAVCGTWYWFNKQKVMDVRLIDSSVPLMSKNILKDVAPGERKITGRLPGLPADSIVPRPLPQSLAGSVAPRLLLDAYGHLARVSTVRDFFDYFLTARNDLTSASLDELVAYEIDQQLHGTLAQVEAHNVWKRYCAYFSELEKLPDMGMITGDKLDLVSIQRAIDQRSSLGIRTLGDWSEPFFGAEQQQQHYDLERLKIFNDQALTDEQKKKRLIVLEKKMPSEVMLERKKIQQQQDVVRKIADLQKDGVGLNGIRSEIGDLLGPDVANRVVQMRREDEMWDEKYKHYAVQRVRIEGQQLEPQEREAQIENLRRRIFTKPSEALRAASFDR